MMLRNTHEQLKKEAESIQILQAHALTEGKAQDLPIYLAGDPGKKGAVAKRANLAIFTEGRKSLMNQKVVAVSNSPIR